MKRWLCLWWLIFPQGLPAAETNPVVQAISPGVYKIGGVMLHQAERRITFPATLNMTSGVLEYAVVHQDGKVHESVLRSSAKPFEIHTAMLLLGVSSTNAVAENAAPGQIEQPEAAMPKGAPVQVEVSWQSGNMTIRRPLSALIYNTKGKRGMDGQPWVYNGSRVNQGRFLAQLSGSIVSLITDFDALINNTSEGHEDDTIWQVNTNMIPPMDVALEITVGLPAK